MIQFMILWKRQNCRYNKTNYTNLCLAALYPHLYHLTYRCAVLCSFLVSLIKSIAIGSLAQWVVQFSCFRSRLSHPAQLSSLRKPGIQPN